MTLWDMNGSPNLGQKTRLSVNKKKKLVDIFIIPNHVIKIKQNEKNKQISRSYQRVKYAVDHEGD